MPNRITQLWKACLCLLNEATITCITFRILGRFTSNRVYNQHEMVDTCFVWLHI